MRVDVISIVLLAGFALAPGCEGRDDTAPSEGQAAASAGAPTLQELRKASYSGLDGVDGTVTLADGRWEGEPFVPGGASRPTVSLGDFRVVGDLDGDGAEEAVVVLAQSSGGSGTFDYLAAVKREGGALRNVATAPLGDRVQVRAARVEGGRLVVDVLQAGEQDAACCPGQLVTRAWTLGPKGLVEASATPTGRLSLEVLAGAEWVLRAWDVGQPAPAEPELTLSYTDGRFAGTSGCNRYTAAARAGEMPGDLSVGPAAGTRMACPEPASGIEARFLRQLAGARKYGFLLGRLALSYQGEAGTWGTMLFERREPPRASSP